MKPHLPPNDHSKWVKNLHALRADPRLRRLAGEQVCTLSLWLARPQKTSNIPLVAYGVMIPSPSSVAGAWSSRDLDRPMLARISLTALAKDLWGLVEGLSNGESLSDACGSASLAQPVEKYGGVCLGTSAEDIRAAYLVRPVGLAGAAGNRVAWKALSSFVPGALSVTGALTLVDKPRLWRDRASDDTAEWLCGVLQILSRETGLAFTGADAARLGDVEFLDASGIHDDGRLLLEVDTIRVPSMPDAENTPEPPDETAAFSVRAVTVRVAEGVLELGARLLLRCRLYSGGTVVLDEIKELELRETETTVTFTSQQEIDGILVSAWRLEDAGWHLWAEHQVGVIKRIQADMGLVGASGYIRSPIFEKYMGSRAKGVAREAAAFERVTHQEILAGGYELAPWVESGEQMIKTAASLFPKESGAAFFPKGWEDSKSPGFLQFVTWLQQTINNPAIGRVLLLDPYFDTLGLELFARARMTGIRYEVLTCTQQRGDLDNKSTDSEDPEPPNLSPEASGPRSHPPRAQRLIDSAQHLRLALEGLDLHLLDLRSLRGGKQGLFHDRYLLLFDTEGRPQRGFNLSNSIQWNNERYPLLVTPIGSDVLGKMAEYIEGLVKAEPPAVHEATVIPLYPVATSKAEGLDNRPNEQPHLARFYAVLLGAPDLEGLCGAELWAALYNCGIGASATEHAPNVDAVVAAYPGFAEALEKADPTEFIELWSALITFLGHTPDHDPVIEAVIHHGATLAGRLEGFIGYALDLDAPVGAKDRPQHLSEMGWLEQYKSLEPALSPVFLRYLEPTLSAWGLGNTAEILMRLDPARLVSALEAQHTHAKTLHAANSDGAEPLALWLYTLLWAIHDELSRRRNDGLLAALLTSRVPLLNQYGLHHLAAATGDEPYPRYSADEALGLLDAVSGAETRRRLLVEWLRWLEANTTAERYQTHPRLRQLRADLFRRVNETLPTDGVVGAVQEVLKLLEDGEPGRDAGVIHREWLSRLAANNRVSADDVWGLWSARLGDELGKCLPSNLLNVQSSTMHRFRGAFDVELTETAVEAVLAASPEAQRQWVEDLGKLVKQGARVLRLPWVRAKHYLPFDSARQGLVWIEHLVDLLELKARPGSDCWWLTLREALDPLGLEGLLDDERPHQALSQQYLRVKQMLRNRG